jgi:signal transduction histidine kinase
MKNYVKPEKSDLHIPIDINNIVESSASILWHHIHKHTENFRTELAEDLPPVMGSRQQLEQVVINLIMNALQSLPDKTRTVAVQTSVDHGKGTISIKVKDEGEGIPEEILDKVAEPFFTTKGDQGGTGLGLYISATIIKEHTGELNFEPTPGIGTTATVTLPIAKTDKSGLPA